VVDRKDVGSWLDGAGARRPGGEQAYAGERLGLPEDGPGSVAGFQRRLLAVTIDWVACVVIARAFSSGPWVPLLVFFVENVLLLSTLRSTFGMRLVGLRVDRVGTTEPASPLRIALRSLLLCLVIPATIWDRDGRGLHDKAAGTVVVRAR
jgi:uncharacterized RDD family membrane protein YckC